MTMLIISLFLACSTEDTRMSWSQHMPVHDFEPPAGDLTWAIAGNASPAYTSNIAHALDEWKLAMSCGFEPRQVEDSRTAMITFICDDPPYSPADHGKIAVGEVEDGSIAVFIKPEFCEVAGSRFFMHAVGHGIGMADDTKWYTNTMSQVSLMPDWWDGDFPALERDGHRIWALNRGAPGCGKDDPQWSWRADPNYYAGELPDLDSLLER